MLEVRDVSFAYEGEDAVLEGVSLTVAPGERVALLGPNGCGKSTLARMLVGALVPCSGTIVVDGFEEELWRKVGYVRQDPSTQIVSSLVDDEVAFGPRNLGLGCDEVAARVTEALDACGIEDLRGRMTTELSGGQQQLVAVAGVLAMRPSYLVLDEADAMLDRESRERLGAVVKRLAERGMGVIEVTHDPSVARRAQRIVRLGPVEGPDVADRVRIAELEPYVTSPIGRLCGRQIEVTYGRRVALSGFSLEVEGLTLLLGPSGAGKSTAARVLAGVLAPDAGEVLLDRAPVRAGQVGLAFQRPFEQLFANTVLEDVMYGPTMQGASPEEAHRMACEACELLGVAEDLYERSPFELSGGQARRVALAGVIAARPKAYVFDEPTAGLDVAGRGLLHRLVAHLVAQGAAVLVITHDEEEWIPQANKVVHLEAPGQNAAPSQVVRAARRPRRQPEPEPGAYNPVSTPVHRIDARIKLAALLLATLSCFAASSPAGFALLAAGLAVTLAASRTSPRTVLRGLKPAAVVLVFSVLANSVVLVGQPGFSAEGLARSAAAVCRIALVVGFALAVTATTQPPAVADAIAAALRPLGRLGFPAAETSMAVSIALRFIPLTMDEVERIRSAQAARGARLGEGGVASTLKGWSQILVPLIVGLFRRADELFAAMRDRGYTGRQTRMDARLGWQDLVVLAAVALWSLLVVVCP